MLSPSIPVGGSPTRCVLPSVSEFVETVVEPPLKAAFAQLPPRLLGATVRPQQQLLLQSQFTGATDASPEVAGALDATLATINSALSIDRNDVVGGADANAPGALRRNLISIVMALLLLASLAVLIVAFADAIANSTGTGIALLLAYAACSVLTYYLEGGNTARMMAKGLPPSALTTAAPIARRFIMADARDSQSIMTFMGVRQFLTLGVTTIAGAVVIPMLDGNVIGDTLRLDSQAHVGYVVIASHLLFTTTVCQVLPQIRAERDLGFLDNWGTLFTYYACAVLGVVLDTSLAAQHIHHAIDLVLRRCCGHCARVWRRRRGDAPEPHSEPQAQQIGSELAAGTSEVEGGQEDETRDFITTGVVKFPQARWPSPQALAAAFERKRGAGQSLFCSRAFLPPAHPQHVPPHVILAILKAVSVSVDNLKPETDAEQQAIDALLGHTLRTVLA